MAERTMLNAFDYVDEFRQQQDQYVDSDTTMGTGTQFGNTLVDDMNGLLGRQGLVDNTDMFAMGLLGMGSKLANRIPAGKSMFSPETMLRANPKRLPVDAPVDTTWSRELASRYGEEFAKDYWMKQEAAKRGKLYTTDVLEEFYAPSLLEKTMSTLSDTYNIPQIKSAVQSGSIGYGYGNKLLGDNNE